MVGSAPTDGTHAAQPCPLRSLALLPPMLRDFAGLAAGVDAVASCLALLAPVGAGRTGPRVVKNGQRVLSAALVELRACADCHQAVGTAIHRDVPKCKKVRLMINEPITERKNQDRS